MWIFWGDPNYLINEVPSSKDQPAMQTSRQRIKPDTFSHRNRRESVDDLLHTLVTRGGLYLLRCLVSFFFLWWRLFKHPNAGVYPQYQHNIGKYTIHGSWIWSFLWSPKNTRSPKTYRSTVPWEKKTWRNESHDATCLYQHGFPLFLTSCSSTHLKVKWSCNKKWTWISGEGCTLYIHI